MEQVRTFLFERTVFTRDQALAFVKKKKLDVRLVQEGKRFWAIYVLSDLSLKGVGRIKQLREGVKAVVVTR